MASNPYEAPRAADRNGKLPTNWLRIYYRGVKIGLVGGLAMVAAWIMEPETESIAGIAIWVVGVAGTVTTVVGLLVMVVAGIGWLMAGMPTSPKEKPAGDGRRENSGG